MIYDRFDGVNPSLSDPDGKVVEPVGGLSIMQWLIALPYTQEELNYLAQLPFEQIEVFLGLPAGTYDYATHYPVLLAYTRRQLAEAILDEMLGVSEEFKLFIAQKESERRAAAKADQDRKIAEAEERARKKAEEEALAAEKAAAEAAAAAGRGLGPIG